MAVPLKGQSENENDIWDDTALIEAYDNAVSSMREQLSGKGIEVKQNLTKDTKDKGKSNQRRKRKKKAKLKNDRRSEPMSSVQWRVGANCRAVFTEDGETYEAMIKSIDLTSNRAVVRYLGYGNEEEQDLDDLLPSEVAAGRNRKVSQSSDVYSESDTGLEGQTWPPSQQQPASRRGSTGSSRGRGIRGPSPMQQPSRHPPPPPPMAGWGSPHHIPQPPPPTHGWMSQPPFNPLQTMFGGAPPMIPPMFASPDFLTASVPNPMSMPHFPAPPPPAIDTEELSEDKEALHNMLISWYMSGYNTGYYQGLKDGRQKSKPSQSVASTDQRSEREVTSKNT